MKARLLWAGYVLGVALAAVAPWFAHGFTVGGRLGVDAAVLIIGTAFAAIVTWD